MNAKLFDEFREIAYSKAGIYLKTGKEALVSARVGKRINRLKLTSARQYLERLRHDESGEELVQFLDVITTNFTSFFREAAHFDVLRQKLGAWKDSGQRTFRIWCAASSSGEEPYSIAITALDALGAADIDLKILATDISMRALSIAVAGVYDAERLAPLSREQFDYFKPQGDGTETPNRYEVRPDVKRLIVFRRINLSKPPFPMRGPLDIVFCRNVMMYFDHAVRHRLLFDVTRLLRPDGLLFTGLAESLTGLDLPFVSLSSSVYSLQRNGR